MPQSIPADTHVPGDPGHTTDHDNVADMLGLICSVLAQAGGVINTSPAPPATAAVAAVQAMLANQTLDDTRYFQPEGFGAKGDGRCVTDGAMTSGNATLTCATSAPFAVTDVGKAVLVQGVGSATTFTTLVTTITGYSSPSVVTLANTASATLSSQFVIFGTDDTAAINAAVTAATAWALAGPMEAIISFLPKIYMVAGQTTKGGASKGNAQIPFPFVSMAVQKLTLVFEGIPDTPMIHYGVNSTPVVGGATVVSCCTTPGSVDATYGMASCFGGYTPEQGAGNGVFSNFRPIFQGLTVICPYNGTYTAVDCYGCTGMGIRSLSCMGFAAPAQMASSGTKISVANRWTCGLRTPTLSNDGNPFIDNYVASGFGNGIALGEHVSASRGFVLYCYNGILAYSDMGATPMLHCTRVHYWCCEANNSQLTFDAGAPVVRLDIGTLDVDSGDQYVINDPSSHGRGEIMLRGNGSSYTFNGGMANLRVIDGDRLRGAATPPSVPATTVALLNPFWRDAAVTIAAGAGVTISAVTVDGTATGLTLASGNSNMMIVPTGKTIALTYAGGTPTWTWVLM